MDGLWPVGTSTRWIVWGVAPKLRGLGVGGAEARMESFVGPVRWPWFLPWVWWSGNSVMVVEYKYSGPLTSLPWRPCLHVAWAG